MTDNAITATSPAPAPRLYFGWRVIAALFLITFALMGVAIYSFIMFAGPLSDQFGWSAAQTGGLVSAMWLAGPLALVAAPIIERVGAWRLVVFGMVVQAIVLASLLFVSAFWQLYALRIAMGVGKIMIMTSAPVIVARWFQHRFATAMGVAWAGGSAGGIVMAPLTETLTSALGWRLTSLALAAGLLAVLGLATLLARGAASPAHLGLRCDGGQASGAGDQAGPAPDPTADEPRLPWMTVVRSMNGVTLATMCIATVALGMACIGIQSQLPALFEGAGISGSTAAALLGLTAAACLVGALLIGWLLDRAHVLWSSLGLSGAMVCGLLALAALNNTPNVALGAAAVCGIGYALGGGEVLWITLFKRQFGVAAFATTYGIFYFCLQVGYATGGLIGGWSLEHLAPLGFLLVAAIWYLPPALFSVWRPGGGKLAASR